MGRDIDAAFLGVALLHRGKEGGEEGPFRVDDNGQSLFRTV